MMTLPSRQRLRFLGLPGLAMILAGCSAAGVLNGVTPSGSFDRDRGVAYGQQDRQTMDIYRASEPRADAPVIVFVYGGGWTRGSKGMYKFVAEGFTKEGYDVVVPDYRLYPDAVYPQMVIDTGAAVQAVAERFPDRKLVLMGHSAGGYNVLMTAFAPDLSGVDVCDRVAGVVSLAAPTGAYPMTDAPYTTIFPQRFGGDDAPINRTATSAPPVFFVNGRDDDTVGHPNATRMAERLDDPRSRVTIYEDMNHIDPVRVLSRHFDGKSPLKDDIIAFIDGLPSGPDTCAR